MVADATTDATTAAATAADDEFLSFVRSVVAAGRWKSLMFLILKRLKS